MKNKANKWRAIGVLLAIAGGIAAFLFYSSGGLTTLFWIGAALGGCGLLMYIVATNESRKVCDACGESLAGCAYAYQEMSRRRNDNPSNPSVTVKVEIRATCPHCQTQKKFTKEFRVTPNSNNLQYEVDTYCRNTFGH